MSTSRPVPLLRLRDGLYRRLPLLPVSEALDRRVQTRATRRSAVSEDGDVAAAREALGADVEAEVVTIIPTYRRPELAALAVQSALLQRVQEHAVILVDDGGGRVPDIKDSRVSVVSLRLNSGVVGYVRNIGLAVSRSPFVAFLDDDNTWAPDHLERALARLRAGADLVYSGLVLVDAAGRVLSERGRPFDRRALAHFNYVDASTIVAWRRPQIRFSPLKRRRGSFRMEDWELVWRVSSTLHVQHEPARTVHYLDNSESFFSELQGPRA